MSDRWSGVVRQKPMLNLLKMHKTNRSFSTYVESRHTFPQYIQNNECNKENSMIDHQLLGRCQKEEMAMMDCLEAYGLDRGLKSCQHFYNDYHECHTLTKQFKRFIVIRKERERQIANGILTGDQKYVTPVIDSY